MFSPSDFNNAVSQFSHGSYASNPPNPLYIEEPGSDDYIHGVAPLQTLPAQWWNWLCNQFTAKLNKINVYVKNIFEELTNLLELVGVTPNASEGGVITSSQIKDAFETKYPNYISKFIHTLAELWSYTGTVIVGDVTTTQTSRLAIFEHVNTSDASTSPATETDEYKTKYVDKLPVKLGGTGADNAGDAMVNLVDPLTTVAQNTGLITDEVVFERDTNGVKSVQKMGLSEVGRIVSSTRVNVPIISASSTTINSAVLAAGDSIQVLFTAEILGTDSTTGLSLIYNGTTTPVKVAKNGSLVDFTATETAINIFKYLQAYTTLELYYDGTNFIIMGNPVVLSSEDYTIYADGYTKDGNVIGTIIPFYGNSVPKGYLACDGTDTSGTDKELQIYYPTLYALLGNSNVLPDLREVTLKGIGETGRTVGAHVKSGGLSIGEFIDDRVQRHAHKFHVGTAGSNNLGCIYTNNSSYGDTTNQQTGRSGDTTEVKAVGVNFIIKATNEWK